MSLLLTADLSSYEALCAAAGDERPHPEQAELEHLGTAILTETMDLLTHTALEDHRATIGEGLLGAFHSIALRIEREHDRAADEVKRLNRDFCGGEIDDVELQDATKRMHAAAAALIGIELMREAASETYTVITGEIWSPWKGSTKRTASTAAQLDAREAIRCRKATRHAASNPGDQVVAFRGSPMADTAEDAGRIFDALNWAQKTWPQMKLATTGLKGAERLALSWAKQKGVDVILARTDFNRHGKAAPFRANDQMMELEPVCILTLANTLNAERASTFQPFGPAMNAGQKAEEKGYRHQPIRVRAQA